MKYKLLQYQDLLIKWNSTINLIGKSTENSLWDRHIVDSMQLLEFIPNLNIHLLDVGSGAGLPGMVLSICGVEHVTLVESDERKAAFLLQASKLSDHKVNIVQDRIENITMNCDILTARAFAPVEKIMKYYTKNIAVKDKYLLFHGANQKYDAISHKSKTSKDSVILEIKV